MIKGKRVGTFTAGITLIGFGILFILHMFEPSLNYRLIFSLWPAILILLGIEILVSYFAGDAKLRYDAGAVVLILILALFAMGMAGAQFFLEHVQFFNGHWNIDGSSATFMTTSGV